MRVVQTVAVKRNGYQVVKNIQERYLRDDIPCLSPLCTLDCKHIDATGNPLSHLLPSESSHYVIPDCQAAVDYLELFCQTSITGLIFLQTALKSIRKDTSQSKNAARARDICNEARRESVVFNNEVSIHTFSPRQTNDQVFESQTDYDAILAYNAAQWYHSHLSDSQMPIVLISDDPNMKTIHQDRFDNGSDRLLVLTMQEYVHEYWADDATITEIHNSLRSALDQAKTVHHDSSSGAAAAASKHGYIPYRSTEALQSNVKSGLFASGVLHVNKYHQNEAVVKAGDVVIDKSPTTSDILIVGDIDRNRAVHGDKVAIELLPKSQWQSRNTGLKTTEKTDTSGAAESATRATRSNDAMPTGKVVGILQRNWRSYVVTMQEGDAEKAGGSKVLGIPADRRIPKIRFATSNKNALKNKRVVVRIHTWSPDSRWPEGHFVRTLGDANNVETETAVILLENQILVPPFSVNQMKEMPVDTNANPWQMDESEIKKRRDVRQSHLIFSIDPLGCEDVDDALGVRRLKNGNIELSVHIADVTHFVRHGSLIDLEARARSTTVYLCDRRYDMLPEVLSANLCSLLSDVDRYAMSVFWELTETCEVVKVWFGRTVIRSAYKLDYEFAQNVAEGLSTEKIVAVIPKLATDINKPKRISELREAVKLLMEVSRKLKEKRVGVGALELESDEIRVKFDDKNKTVQDLVAKKGLEIHETIAECMIFANGAVAEKISSAFVNSAVLRRHPLPQEQQFDRLIRAAAVKGFSIDISSNFTLARSLDAAVDPADSQFNRILRTMATAAMSEAVYFRTGAVDAAEWLHYGLGLNYYTHFTSPIRRYADILVHRQLMAAISLDNHQALDQSSTQGGLAGMNITACTDNMNLKTRTAKEAQKQSLDLFRSIYFMDRMMSPQECEVDAVIVEIKDNGFMAFVAQFGMKSPVYLKAQNGMLILPTALVHPKSKQTYEEVEVAGTVEITGQTITVKVGSGEIFSFSLFDHVRTWVSVEPNPYHLPKLRLHLVNKDETSATHMKPKLSMKDAVLQPRLAMSSNALKQLPHVEDPNVAHYTQSSGKNAYNIIEVFKALSLEEDDS
eukprot:m.205994 g.205994  ORF g.205994 m.205994 type:complete len:1079 (-) comp32933_c0_seq1:110-3346(-)